MIGAALVTDPRMIVLDEPLSGLDSYNALIVTQTLRSLADKGRVVLYSLHQPSNDIFTSLDDAIFMAHGRIVYQGPPGDCLKSLHDAGVDASGAIKTNGLADTMMYALNDPMTCEKLIRASSTEVAEVAENGTTATTGTTATIGSSSSIKSASPSIALQTSTVFWRTLTDVWRNKSLLVLHVCIAIAAGLIMGGLFFELGYDTQGVQVGIDHD